MSAAQSGERKGQLGRRSFVKGATVAAVAPMIVPSRIFGQTAPSNALVMASIGTGRMGHGDMQECQFRGLEEGVNARIVAVCDVDLGRAENAKNVVEQNYSKELGENNYKGVQVYQDFRELLDRGDIDGITCSTPEHWHALVAIAASEKGIGAYVQKPLTYSVAEGQKLVEVVRKNKTVLQVGSQQRSDVYFRKTCELVRNGRLGKLEAVEVHLPPDVGSGEYREMAPPENFNYEMWMGGTEPLPYTQDRVHPQRGFGRPGWLQVEQYCRGMITGWGAHMYDIAQWGLGTDMDSGPVEVEASAAFPERGIFDVHTEYESQGMYANGVKLIAKTANPAGVKFIGEKGWIWVQRGSFKAEPESLLREQIGENEIHLYESKNHMRDYLTSLREGKDPIAPVEAGHRSNTVCVITHIAMKLNRKLYWDPKTERFKDDDQANAMLDYKHFNGWTV